MMRKSYLNGTAQSQYYYFDYNTFGQNTKISVGSRELASYTYEANGGKLSQMSYSNGDSVTYTYDEFDRLVRTWYNDTGNYVTYTYNAQGALATLSYHEGSNVTTYSFEYDSLGRLIRSRETTNGTTKQRTEHLYDEFDRLYIQRWNIDGKTRSEKYTYDDAESGDGALTQFKSGSGHKINYTYDVLRRLTTASVTNSSNVELFKTAYAYLTLSGSQTSTLVQYRSVRAPNGTLLMGHRYYYDAIGNITKIVNTETGYTAAEYTYDNQNQLTQEIYYTSDGAVGDTYIKRQPCEKIKG